MSFWCYVKNWIFCTKICTNLEELEGSEKKFIPKNV
jgi:hypothetical protein